MISRPYDWRALADLHRPKEAADMTAAITELHSQGLKPWDIADALRVDLPTVTLTLARLGL
jgi:hypothetical protein